MGRGARRRSRHRRRHRVRGGEAGILRFDFPGGAGEDQLEHIDWDEWFDKFEKKNLALLYQDEKSDGEGSTFFKLVTR